MLKKKNRKIVCPMWILRLSISFQAENQRDSDGARAAFASDLWFIMFASRSRFVSQCCGKTLLSEGEIYELWQCEGRNKHAPLSVLWVMDATRVNREMYVIAIYHSSTCATIIL